MLRDQNHTYTVVPTVGALAHEELASKEDEIPGTQFCRLDFVGGEHEELKSHNYVHLGWLVKQNIRTTMRVTTNYVLLLEVTKERTSLRLVYDYVHWTLSGEFRLNVLQQTYNDLEHKMYVMIFSIYPLHLPCLTACIGVTRITLVWGSLLILLCYRRISKTTGRPVRQRVSM